MILINLIVLVAVVVSLLMPTILLDWTCISFAAILFYCYYNQLVHQIDDLTGLLNRMSMDQAVAQIRKPVVIIFFDVDRFKQINDEYGHNFGDSCLEMVSKALRESGYTGRVSIEGRLTDLPREVREAQALMRDLF